MSAEVPNYLMGYSIGAGAIVLSDDHVLLVRLSYGSSRGMWSLPGGYVEPGETAEVAARREVLEETGVVATVEGLIAVRSRVLPNENSIYLIFLLRAASLESHPDGAEVLDARFFSRTEVATLPDMTPMTRLLVAQAFDGSLRTLSRTPVPPYPEHEFALFL